MGVLRSQHGDTHATGKRVLAIVAVIAVLLIAAAAYYRIGWWRMEAACLSSPPGTNWQVTAADYGFTKHGFTCERDDGSVWSSWWP